MLLIPCEHLELKPLLSQPYFIYPHIIYSIGIRGMFLVSWNELIASRLHSTRNQDELEVCSCDGNTGLLVYEVNTQEYTGKGTCKPDLICATLMIEKHRALLSTREVKKHPHRATTLDEFF